MQRDGQLLLVRHLEKGARAIAVVRPAGIQNESVARVHTGSHRVDEKGSLERRDKDNGRYCRDRAYSTHRCRSQLTWGTMRGNSVPLHSCSRRDFAFTNHWHMPSYSYGLHAVPMCQV